MNCAFRTTKNIVLSDGSRINKLFLTIDQTFFKSCFRDANLDIRVGDEDLVLPPPQNQGHPISKKNLKEKKISMKPVFSQTKNLSNFVENNSKEKRESREGDKLRELRRNV